MIGANHGQTACRDNRLCVLVAWQHANLTLIFANLPSPKPFVISCTLYPDHQLQVRFIRPIRDLAIFAQTCYSRRRTVPKRVTWIVTLLIVAFTNTSRHAGAAGDPAELLIRQGVELRKKGKDAEAVERFQQAYDLAHTARAAAQLGLCEQALERWVDADAHLAEALASSDPWIERKRTILEQSLNEVRSRLATVTVTGAPEGAVVRINEQVAGVLPSAIPMRIVAGKAIISVTAAGHRRKQIERVVNAGESVAIEVTLESDPALVGQTPQQQSPAGEDATPSTPALPAHTDHSSGRGLRIGAYAAWGVSVLALGLGIHGHLQRESAASDFASPDNACDKANGVILGGTRCEAYADQFDSGGTRMVIGYVSAGVLAGAGLTMWLLARPEAPSDETTTAHFGCVPLLAGGTCFATF